jgi:hypothetical protein
MKTTITDFKNVKYDFSFEGTDVIVSNGEKLMAMPIQQIIDNSGPWQFLKNEYIKMSKEAVCYIETICVNKVY